MNVETNVEALAERLRMEMEELGNLGEPPILPFVGARVRLYDTLIDDPPTEKYVATSWHGKTGVVVESPTPGIPDNVTIQVDDAPGRSQVWIGYIRVEPPIIEEWPV